MIANYTLNKKVLYYMTVDPRESENVIAHYPEQAEVMRRYLNTWMEEMTETTETAPQLEMDKELTESLKALGYL